MPSFKIQEMPEILASEPKANGMVVQLTNDAATGWRVYIIRPDGSAEYRQVANKMEGRTLMGEIVDGQFPAEETPKPKAKKKKK